MSLSGEIIFADMTFKNHLELSQKKKENLNFFD